MTPDQIIKKYIEIRNAIADREKALETELAPYKQGLVTLEGAMHKHLTDNNLENVKSEHGTAFFKSGSRVKLADRNAFQEFVWAQGDLGYFTAAISKEKVLEYVEQNNAPPPGVDVTHIVEVQFRKS